MLAQVSVLSSECTDASEGDEDYDYHSYTDDGVSSSGVCFCEGEGDGPSVCCV